jgi:hypothetical protein
MRQYNDISVQGNWYTHCRGHQISFRTLWSLPLTTKQQRHRHVGIRQSWTSWTISIVSFYDYHRSWETPCLVWNSVRLILDFIMVYVHRSYCPFIKHWWFSGKIGRCHLRSNLLWFGQPRVRFPADAWHCHHLHRWCSFCFLLSCTKQVLLDTKAQHVEAWSIVSITVQAISSVLTLVTNQSYSKMHEHRDVFGSGFKCRSTIGHRKWYTPWSFQQEQKHEPGYSHTKKQEFPWTDTRSWHIVGVKWSSEVHMRI